MGESGSGGRLAGPGGDEEEEPSTVTDGSSSSTPRLAIRSSSDGRALRRLLTPKPSMQNSFSLDFCSENEFASLALMTFPLEVVYLALSTATKINPGDPKEALLNSAEIDLAFLSSIF